MLTGILGGNRRAISRTNMTSSTYSDISRYKYRSNIARLTFREIVPICHDARMKARVRLADHDTIDRRLQECAIIFRIEFLQYIRPVLCFLEQVGFEKIVCLARHDYKAGDRRLAISTGGRFDEMW